MTVACPEVAGLHELKAQVSADFLNRFASAIDAAYASKTKDNPFPISEELFCAVSGLERDNAMKIARKDAKKGKDWDEVASCSSGGGT